MAELKGDLGKYLSGMPIMVAGANVAVSQPSVKDICAFGETDFFMSIELFVKSKEIADKIKDEGKSQLGFMNDFQVLLVMIQEHNETKDNVDKLFELIFPNYLIEYDTGCINFRTDENGPIVGQLNPLNFDNFKTTLKELFLPSGGSDDEPEFNPGSDKAAEIAAKLNKGRQMRQELKSGGKQKISSVYANYVSALSVGLAMNINELYNYTPFQLLDAFKRYAAKMAYDLYQRVSTMPMMDVSKMDEPKNWVDDLY